MIIYLFVLVLLVIIYYNLTKYEYFNKDMTEQVPLGEQRYDLRGLPLYNHPLYDCWYDNYRNCYNSNF